MHRQILASSAILMAAAAAAGASATIWVLLTQPPAAVIALADGDLARVLLAVLGVISDALWGVLEYL
jgi:hypothetical protein